MSEADESLVYKNVITSMLAEGSMYCPFRKEKQMDYLFDSLKHDFQQKNQRILDACCGYGRLIHFLDEFDHEQHYVGIDYVAELVEKGSRLFSERQNISFVCDDVLRIAEKYPKEFDIAINYKTLSWFPYYRDMITVLFKVTRSKIYITSLFYDGDIDFITKIFQDASSSKAKNYTYLNTYSLPRFKKFCYSLGARDVVAMPMNLDFALPEQKDVNKLQTYTACTTEGNYLEITGNVILNWKLVEIVIG